jgi:hypothetical protein
MCFKFYQRLTTPAKAIFIIVVVLVVYFIMKRTEGMDSVPGEPQIVNKPNNNQDATELKQPDYPTVPMVYDRKTGIATAASEFIGLPEEILPASGTNSVANYGAVDRLDDGYNGAMGLNYNMCSKSCCGPQYPPPFSLEEDAMVEKNKDQFVPNNYSCNNAWNNTGCVCMTKKQHNYIQSRGGNSN